MDGDIGERVNGSEIAQTSGRNHPVPTASPQFRGPIGLSGAEVSKGDAALVSKTDDNICRPALGRYRRMKEICYSHTHRALVRTHHPAWTTTARCREKIDFVRTGNGFILLLDTRLL